MSKVETVDVYGREDGGEPRQYLGAYVPVRLVVVERVEAAEECETDAEYQGRARRQLCKRLLHIYGEGFEILGFGAIMRDQQPGSSEHRSTK